MRIEISGHQIDVTQALRDYVHSKLQRLEQKYPVDLARGSAVKSPGG